MTKIIDFVHIEKTTFRGNLDFITKVAKLIHLWCGAQTDDFQMLHKNCTLVITRTSIIIFLTFI